MPLAPFPSSIVRRRWWIAVTATFALAALGLGFVPLLSTIGYEYAAAFAVPAALVGGLVGVASVSFSRANGRPAHPLEAFAWALPAALAPLLLPLLIGFAHGLHQRNCTPSLTLAFWLLMPVGSAAFSLALGIAVARATATARRAAGLFVALVIASLARFGLGLLDGPDIYGGNHFFGWFSGGIYEDVIEIDAGLLYLRLLSALIALTLLLGAALVPQPGEERPRWRSPATRWQCAALGLVLVAFGIGWHYRQLFRLDVDRAFIQRSLGGHLRTDHFDIYYEAGAMPPHRLRLVAQDHEYRLARVSEYLQTRPSRRIASYVFRDAASKRRWTGSGWVQVANPWRREIYINDDGYPHAVLEHELTHVVSAEFGVPVFGYSMGGPLPNAGLIEGIAVATSWHDRGRGDPHAQSAAMLKEGILPEPSGLVGITFWGDRQSRAYTAAGSFVRFLVEAYGIEKVKSAYAWGDLAGATGKDLAHLGDEWRAFLATIEVPEAERAAARERFTQPSLFERTCARELSRLEEEGWRALRGGRFDEARAMFTTWRALDDRPEPLRAILELERRQGNPDEALRVAGRLVEAEVPGSPGTWRARMAVADLQWTADLVADAEAGYRAALEAAATPDLEREAWFKLAAVRRAGSEIPSERALSRAMRDWFLPPPHGGSIVPLVATTTAATIDGSDWAYLGAYLIGRNLLLGGQDAERALPWLEAAANAPVELVDSAAVRAETLILRADALTRIGRYDDAEEAWRFVRDLPGVPGETLDVAVDGLARTEWLRGRRPDAGERTAF